MATPVYFGLGAPELIIILLIPLLLFGANKLPKLSKSIGESAKGLRKGLSDDTEAKEDDSTKTSKKKS
ncbi:twin-arginine translocase TatA/TatE family subunit [Candidatus Saccharibacteria bacterium]|nr:twin-arginine translocase TatA/TatE family subunit [Candidatus Saccharibacteria bacterium]